MTKKRRYKRRGGKGATLFSGLFLGLLFIGLYAINLSKGETIDFLPIIKDLPHPAWNLLLIPAASILILSAVSFLMGRITRSMRKQRLRVSGIYRIDKMTGSEFENYLTVFFEDLKYRVEEVGGKGDKGADRILIEPGTGKRICVQAKCWDKNVTFEAVQQVFTAKTLWRCDEAWIITNRGFTKQVRETADELAIDLWDRERLIDNMYQYNKRKKKAVNAPGNLFLASPESKVFHDLSCEHGRNLKERDGAICFDSYNLAVKSGRRKCSCYK